jgi:hypothetical protein
MRPFFLFLTGRLVLNYQQTAACSKHAASTGHLFIIEILQQKTAIHSAIRGHTQAPSPPLTYEHRTFVPYCSPCGTVKKEITPGNTNQGSQCVRVIPVRAIEVRRLAIDCIWPCEPYGARARVSVRQRPRLVDRHVPTAISYVSQSRRSDHGYSHYFRR